LKPKKAKVWHEVKKGTAKTLIEHIASDTKGTFHGLGALNENLSETGGTHRLPVDMDKNLNFTYANTDKR